MKTVKISESFTGYPAGKRREFAKGEEPELAVDYADLLVEKGLAREVEATSGGKAPAKKETKER